MGDIEVEERVSKSKKIKVWPQSILRIVVIVCTLGATWMIITAKQTVEILGLTLDAKYSYSPAFKFFAIANGIVCCLCIASMILVCMSGCREEKKGKGKGKRKVLFISDVVMMSLVLGGCAAASAIGYVGKYGDSHTGWQPICDHFGKFCNRVTISVALSYIALLFLFLLTLLHN